MASKTKTKKAKVDGKSTQTRPTTGVKTPPIPIEQGGLSIGDLKNISTVMDVASTRGAFRANEMATVGLIYNKLQAFLAKVSPPEPKKDEAGAKTTAPITTPTSTIAPTSTLASTSK